MIQRKTKILATVGPTSSDYKTLLAMILAGVNVFRMNFSHGTHQTHLEILKIMRKAINDSGKTIGILQDISGPKIRVCELPHPVEVIEKDTIIFIKNRSEKCSIDKNSITLYLNRPEILNKVKIGQSIYIYDGKIKTTITLIDDEKIITTVNNYGIISSHKGVNFPNTKLGIDVLTNKDRNDILWGIKNNIDFMAISFVQKAKDIQNVRKFIDEHDGNVQIYAKIEKFDAIENIDDIISVSDGIMVARGDLGIEVPYQQVPIIQKKVIKKANEVGIPVITATQMLLSMTKHDNATRAEISDVANAVLDGTDAVMLSEESAIGVNPPKVVQTMASTIVQTESIYPYGKKIFKSFDDIDTITQSITSLAQNLEAQAIISLTSSGSSSQKMARYRVKTPIFAISHEKKIARLLTMVWGIYPIACVKKDDLHNMLGDVLRKMIDMNELKMDKTYIAVAGYPIGVAGTTNFIRILKKEEIIFYSKK